MRQQRFNSDSTNSVRHGGAEVVVGAYKDFGGTVDDSFTARLAKHRVLREFGGIRYASRHNDQAELTASINKLRQTGVIGGRD